MRWVWYAGRLGSVRWRVQFAGGAGEADAGVGAEDGEALCAEGGGGVLQVGLKGWSVREDVSGFDHGIAPIFVRVEPQGVGGFRSAALDRLEVAIDEPCEVPVGVGLAGVFGPDGVGESGVRVLGAGHVVSVRVGPMFGAMGGGEGRLAVRWRRY